MTLWRRHRVRRVIDWWDYDAPPDIDWDVIKAVFKAAFIELVAPGGSQGINDAVRKNKKRAEYVELFREVAVAQGNHIIDGVEKERFVWSPRAIVPIRWKRQEKNEPLEDWWSANNGHDMVEKLKGGGGYLYAMYRVPASFLKGIFDETDEAGMIIVRFQQMRPYAFPDLFNDADRVRFNNGTLRVREKKEEDEEEEPVLDAGNVGTRMKNYKTDSGGRGDGGPSIGVDWGFVFLEHQHFKDHADGFLTLHEMGHCFYLSHALDYDPALKADHDREDFNCAMFYPSQTPFGADGWGKRVKAPPKPTAPHFCGKCLLKLRGWRLRDGAGPALPKEST
jgi:hypothetical protein